MVGAGVLLAWITLIPSGPEDDQRAHDRALVQRYSPVFVQELSHQPWHDLITAFDFDGNATGEDNLENASRYALPAVVYGDLVAETEDSCFLFYGVYHLRDYDKPLRELFFPSAAHDNDFEGLMLLVDKVSGDVVVMETWFHSMFLQFAGTPAMGKTQTVDGKLHVEDETHPLVYVQALGHGVRGLQKIDEDVVRARPHLVYRWGAARTETQTPALRFASYEIVSMDRFVAFSRGPFGADGMLAEPADFGIGGAPLGLYLSGRFRGDSSWARPKPPWRWTDKFDPWRPGAWFFHPAYVLLKHFDLPGRRSVYWSNLANDAMLGATQADLDGWAEKRGTPFFGRSTRGVFYTPMKRLRKSLFRLTEWLFYWLG